MLKKLPKFLVHTKNKFWCVELQNRKHWPREIIHSMFYHCWTLQSSLLFSIPSRYMLCNNILHWPCNMVIFNVCPFVVWLLTTILEETFLSLEWSRLDRWRLSLDLDLSLLDFFVLSTGLCRSGDRLCLLRTWLSGLLRLDGVVRSSESLPSVVLLCLLLFWEGWVTTETRLLKAEVELSPSSRTVFGLGSLGAAVVSGCVFWAASVVLE